MTYPARYAEASRNGAARRWIAEGARRKDRGRPEVPVEGEPAAEEPDTDPGRGHRLARVVHVATYAEAPARCWEPLCRGPWRRVETGYVCASCSRTLYVEAALRRRERG